MTRNTIQTITLFLTLTLTLDLPNLINQTLILTERFKIGGVQEEIYPLDDLAIAPLRLIYVNV